MTMVTMMRTKMAVANEGDMTAFKEKNISKQNCFIFISINLLISMIAYLFKWSILNRVVQMCSNRVLFCSVCPLRDVRNVGITLNDGCLRCGTVVTTRWQPFYSTFYLEHENQAGYAAESVIRKPSESKLRGTKTKSVADRLINYRTNQSTQLLDVV